MALGAQRISGAELTVALTGIAGPGGALPGKPVGTVYLGGYDARHDRAYLMRLTLGGYRERGIIRTRAALYALDLLRRMALDLPQPEALTLDAAGPQSPRRRSCLPGGPRPAGPLTRRPFRYHFLEVLPWCAHSCASCACLA